jgi:hypothetical protein
MTLKHTLDFQSSDRLLPSDSVISLGLKVTEAVAATQSLRPSLHFTGSEAFRSTKLLIETVVIQPTKLSSTDVFVPSVGFASSQGLSGSAVFQASITFESTNSVADSKPIVPSMEIASTGIFGASIVFGDSNGLLRSPSFHISPGLKATIEFSHSDAFQLSTGLSLSKAYGSHLLAATMVVPESQTADRSLNFWGSNAFHPTEPSAETAVVGPTEVVDDTDSFDPSAQKGNSKGFSRSVDLQGSALLESLVPFIHSKGPLPSIEFDSTNKRRASADFVESPRYKSTNPIVLSTDLRISNPLLSSANFTASKAYESNDISGSNGVAPTNLHAPTKIVYDSSQFGGSVDFHQTDLFRQTHLYQLTQLIGSDVAEPSRIVDNSNVLRSIDIHGSMRFGNTIQFWQSNGLPISKGIVSKAFRATTDVAATDELARTVTVIESSRFAESVRFDGSKALKPTGRVNTEEIVSSNQYDNSALLLPSAAFRVSVVFGNTIELWASKPFPRSKGVASIVFDPSAQFAVSDGYAQTAFVIGSSRYDNSINVDGSLNFDASIPSAETRLLKESQTINTEVIDFSAQLQASKELIRSVTPLPSIGFGATNLLAQSQAFVASVATALTRKLDVTILVQSSAFGLSSLLPASGPLFVTREHAVTDLKPTWNPVVSQFIDGSGRFDVTQLAQTDHFMASELIDISEKYEITSAVKLSSVVPVSVLFGLSDNFAPSVNPKRSLALTSSESAFESAGLAGTPKEANSEVFVASRLANSVSFDGTAFVATGIHGESDAPGGTGLYLVSDSYNFTNDLAASGEPFEATDAVEVSSPLAGTGFGRTETNRESQFIALSAKHGDTWDLTASGQFAASRQLVASLAYRSQVFDASDYFTASVFVSHVDEKAGGSGGGQVPFVTGITIGLLSLLALIPLSLFLIRRRGKRDASEDALGYETEANAMDVSDSDTSQDDDWSIDEFDRAVECAFDGGPSAYVTNIAPTTGDQLFPSDCDEIF